MMPYTFRVQTTDPFGKIYKWTDHKTFKTIDERVDYYWKLVDEMNKLRHVQSYTIKVEHGHAA